MGWCVQEVYRKEESMVFHQDLISFLAVVPDSEERAQSQSVVYCRSGYKTVGWILRKGVKNLSLPTCFSGRFV